jgi:L-asparaginase/Glu-tRNA(Gln) amidotransferase subunit D
LRVDSRKPVVLVGAQRNASEPDFDGPRNLLNALRIAVDEGSTGVGAMKAYEQTLATDPNRLRSVYGAAKAAASMGDAAAAKSYYQKLVLLESHADREAPKSPKQRPISDSNRLVV